MKFTKSMLRKIIKEERSKILEEGARGAAGVGFAQWSPNRTPDFAKSYGRGARVIGQYQNNNDDLTEQPMPAPSSDPKENAFQELKYSGAFKDLQELMHDCSQMIGDWQDKHETKLADAGMQDVGGELEDARLTLEDLRQLANQFRQDIDMKVSKRQLRQIIKEEKTKLLSEQGSQTYNRDGTSQRYDMSPTEISKQLGLINDAVSFLLNNGMDPEELSGELQDIADSVLDLDNQQGR